jgi:hypothetical protein
VRKFASEADLRRYALEKGASVALGGGTFNAGREQVRIEWPPAKRPAQRPSEPPREAQATTPQQTPSRDQAAEAIAYQTVTLAEFFRDLIDTLREAPANDRSDAWDFEVHRNNDGLISRVTARALSFDQGHEEIRRGR